MTDPTPFSVLSVGISCMFGLSVGLLAAAVLLSVKNDELRPRLLFKMPVGVGLAVGVVGYMVLSGAVVATEAAAP